MFVCDENKKLKIDCIIANMTLREKIGQTVQYRISRMEQYAQSDELLEEFFQRYPVGSLFAGPDVISRFSIKDNPLEFLDRCRKYSRVAPAIAGDLEHGGGKVQLPSQLAMAASGSEENAYNYGKWSAIGGRKAGFTWAFAPESDIAFNWLNPVNNHRGLGDDPEVVAKLIPLVVKGMQDYHVSACCKHFPGDGVDFRDQHLGISINRLSRERWFNTYGKVYRNAIAAGVDSIMAGHISLPFMDPGKPYPLPATQSKKILTDLLRNELGFEGVIVSDALIMGGFSRVKHYADRMVNAFKAGVDVMLWPELDYFELMEKELESGGISEARLDESVRRILTMKCHQGLLEETSYQVPESEEEITVNGNIFAEKVAAEGAVLLRNDLNLIPLDPQKTKRILLWFAVNREEVVARDFSELVKAFEERGIEVEVRINGNCLDLVNMENEGAAFDAVFFIFDASLHAMQNTCRIVGSAAECLWTINNCEKHHPICIGLNTPYLLMESPALETVINTHSRCPATCRILPKLIFGELPFTGKSPVNFGDLLGVDPAL